MNSRLVRAALGAVMLLSLAPRAARAQYGRAVAVRRAVVVTAVVVSSASRSAAASQQSAAASQQSAAQAQTSQQQAATAQQQSATAEQQSATAAQQSATAQQQVAGGVAVGTIISTLPAGCTKPVVSGVEYNHCGSTYYRAAFNGDALVYVAVAPPT